MSDMHDNSGKRAMSLDGATQLTLNEVSLTTSLRMYLPRYFKQILLKYIIVLKGV